MNSVFAGEQTLGIAQIYWLSPCQFIEFPCKSFELNKQFRKRHLKIPRYYVKLAKSLGGS